MLLFFFKVTATPESYTYGHTLSLHDALPICRRRERCARGQRMRWRGSDGGRGRGTYGGGLMPGAASVPVSSGEGVAAIVVTHERAATIDDCLARLRAARGVSQVRVVDNGSRDDTLAIVQRHAATDPRVHFIANPD